MVVSKQKNVTLADDLNNRNNINKLNVTQIYRKAGISSIEKNSPKERDLELCMKNSRSYKLKDETDRAIKQGEIRIKDFYFYNRKDSLWNDYDKLAKPIAKFSVDNIDPNTTFKKTTRNLSQIV